MYTTAVLHHKADSTAAMVTVGALPAPACSSGGYHRTDDEKHRSDSISISVPLD